MNCFNFALIVGSNMLRIMCFFSILQVIVHGEHHIVKRIVNGEDADIIIYPFMISFQLFGSHFCGGSIISKNRCLTAAHCLHGLDAKHMSVRVGSSVINSGGTVVAVKEAIPHPKFKSEKPADYDIAVLKLAAFLNFGVGIEVIPVTRFNVAWTGEDATILGWGYKKYNGVNSNHLQRTTVKKISQSQCRSIYKRLNITITDRMLCFYEKKKDGCQGDSGGPLVARGKQLGVISAGIGCATELPGIYANLPKLYPFISKNLK